MEIRTLSREDVPAAMELSRQANWNQAPADWEWLIDLAPEGCFGGWIDGQLVATSTLITYGGAGRTIKVDGNVGWLGMVLVDEDHRRNGYGGTIVDHVLKVAEHRDVAVGLDATDAGRPLYRRRGFVDVCPIERWSGSPPTDCDCTDASAPESNTSADVVPIDADRADAVCEFDRRACGIDRSDLLRRLLDEDGVAGIAIRDDSDGSIRGYAVGRPGREFAQIGPVIASAPADVESLIVRAADAVDQEAVLVDVLAVDAVADVLERLVMECQRRLTRMTYPDSRRLLVGSDVVAAAGFELG